MKTRTEIFKKARELFPDDIKGRIEFIKKEMAKLLSHFEKKPKRSVGSVLKNVQVNRLLK